MSVCFAEIKRWYKDTEKKRTGLTKKYNLEKLILY